MKISIDYRRNRHRSYRSLIKLKTTSSSNQHTRMMRSGYRLKHILPLKPYICCILFLISCLFSPFASSMVDAQVIGITGPAIDEDACFEDLLLADTNNNRTINEDEFVTFTKLQAELTTDAFEKVNDFSSLPNDFVNLYTTFACKCENCKTICQTGFSIVGVSSGDNLTNDQSKFLYQVCSKIYQEIQNFVPDRLPTPNPTVKPTLAPSPIPSGDPLLYTGSLSMPLELTLIHAEGVNAASMQNEENNSIMSDIETSIAIIIDRIVSTYYSDSRFLRRRRKLRVSFMREVPVILNDVLDRECPNLEPLGFSLNEGISCVDFTAEITIYLEDENMSEIQNDFTQYMKDALNDSELQKIAESKDGNILFLGVKQEIPADPVRIVLGPGELAGIGAAGFVVGFALIGGMFIQSRRRRYAKEINEVLHDDYFDEYEENMNMHSKPPFNRDQMSDPAHLFNNAMPEDKSERSFNESIDSSNAGSSGWSSGGVSSLNTSSVDSFDNDKVFTHGASLAAIGLASGISNNLYGANDRYKNKFGKRFSPFSRTGTSDGDTLSTNSDDNAGNVGLEGGVPAMPTVSRNDLDAAIQAGDWAAVGATAALLANAASDTNSVSTKSYSSKKSSTSSVSRTNSAASSVDAARAAELDQLVDAGDWEGVVLAASKFDVASDKGSHDGEGNKSFTSEDIQSNFSTSTRGASGYTPASLSMSGASGTSETWSRTKKRDEIRNEVEELVRRVVPDEIGNVDEMMIQFRGREEELLETLRTMQERSIAQRARANLQRTAKREARTNRTNESTSANKSDTSSVKSGKNSSNGSTGLGAILAAVTSSRRKKGKEKSDNSQQSSVSSGYLGNISSKKKTALDHAIDSGDWEAVGEAAAMLSDSDASSLSTAALQRIADEGSVMSDSSATISHSSFSSSLYSDSDARPTDLDSLIDEGNWEGVVAVANKVGSAGETVKSDSSSKRLKNKNRVFGKKKQRGITQAEIADASAQADLWMEIAAQSKKEGTAKGASDAADWAISRSLSALLQAEKKGGSSRIDGSSLGSRSSKGDGSV